MTAIKTIFLGTGDIGVKLLQALHDDPRFEVNLVVTSPDRPAGRKMELQPSPIKKRALELGIEVFQPENIKTPEAIEYLKKFEPQIMLVIAYGQLLSQEVLDIPKIDCLNVHASLLPKYRGASPIQSVLLNGEKETGVTLMKVVKKMDAGPIYKIYSLSHSIEHETAGTLEKKLGELSAKVVPQGIIEVAEGKLKPVEQDEHQATYVTKISKADGQIDWSEPAQLIERKIRAFDPWPSTYTFYKGKRLKILKAKVQSLSISEQPGKVVQKEGWTGVVTGNSILELIEVQLEGKKPQSMKEFLNGNGDFLGIRLH